MSLTSSANIRFLIGIQFDKNDETNKFPQSKISIFMLIGCVCHIIHCLKRLEDIYHVDIINIIYQISFYLIFSAAPYKTINI